MFSFNLEVFSFIFFLSIQIGISLVPEVCVFNVTSTDKTCCPVPNGYHLPCGGRGRGVCDKLYIHWDNVESVLVNDDRLNWPIRFFKRMCRCEGNFFGIACESCWYGWKGKDCNERQITVRRNIKSFSRKEKEIFQKILLISYNMPSEFMILKEEGPLNSDPLKNPQFIKATFQQFIAFIHRYASRSTLFEDKNICDVYGFLDYNHNTVSFATWHRALMLHWERELAKIAWREFGWKDFGIPYWDWVDAKSCEVCTNDLVGATGRYDPIEGIWLLDERSPFHNWIEYCSPPKNNARCVGCHYRKKFPPLNRNYTAYEFPTTESLTFSLRHKSYYLKSEAVQQPGKCPSFQKTFEGFCGPINENEKFLFMHNRVHNMVDGSMCCASTASNDPLFILHHSQIDRIFECWFEIFSPTVTQLPNHGVEPGNCRECNIVGYLPPIKHAQMFTYMKQFGIVYDNLSFGRKGFECPEMAKLIRKNTL